MKATIYPGRIHGQVQVPPSKSYAQRAILMAALAPGTSRLRKTGMSDDVLHAIHNAISLGAEIRIQGDSLEITGGNPPRSDRFFAGESGLTARILSAVLMMHTGNRQLTGSGSLLRRPFDAIFPIYKAAGLTYRSENGYLPIELTGRFTETDFKIDGSTSSQFISGLFIALAAAGYQGQIIVENPVSRPYLRMTIDALAAFGASWEETTQQTYRLSANSSLRAADFSIEGDWSSGAMLIAAGLTAGPLSLSGLDIASLQADQSIIKLFSSYFHREEDGTLFFQPVNLQGFSFDASDCPDLFPPLAVIASQAAGPSRIKGVHRLKSKESDRAAVLQEEFGKLWIRIDIEGDEMIVQPSRPTGGRVQAHNDHRIAMALSILALNASEPVIIDGVECISKSYPLFLNDLERLGAKMVIDER